MITVPHIPLNHEVDLWKRKEPIVSAVSAAFQPQNTFIPVAYSPPTLPSYYFQFVIVDWLEQSEAELAAQEKMPALYQLVGYRTREVYRHVQDYMPLYDMRITAEMYGLNSARV